MCRNFFAHKVVIHCILLLNSRELFFAKDISVATIGKIGRATRSDGSLVSVGDTFNVQS